MVLLLMVPYDVPLRFVVCHNFVRGFYALVNIISFQTHNLLFSRQRAPSNMDNNAMTVQLK
jgi:hypothetical protein